MANAISHTINYNWESAEDKHTIINHTIEELFKDICLKWKSISLRQLTSKVSWQILSDMVEYVENLINELSMLESLRTVAEVGPSAFAPSGF